MSGPAAAFGWHDAAGIVGVAAIVGSYLALQLGRMDGRGTAYAAINATGAALILLSLAFDFNLSAFVVESFWLAISLIGVGRGLLRRRGASRVASGGTPGSALGGGPASRPGRGKGEP